MMTSGRNDYSACSTWLVHKNDAYLVHVYRGRLEYPDPRRKVIGLAAEHRATTVLIEDAGPGIALRRSGWPRPRASCPNHEGCVGPQPATPASHFSTSSRTSPGIPPFPPCCH